jgi:HlyD family secretion protein
MKKIIWIAIGIVIIAAIYFIWNSLADKKANHDGATRISTAVARKGNLSITVSSTGTVQPILTVDLKSKASGEIIEIPIEEGDFVNKGDLIAKLDAKTSKNSYDQAVADLGVAEKTLSLAEKEATRQSELYKQSLISELEYENSVLTKEQANSNVVKARANLEDAKERLSDTVIKSPISGIVLRKFVEEGQIIASGISAVSGGTTIALVADLSKAYIRTAVDEVDIGQIQSGQQAVVIAESFPDRTFDGKVIRIHPQATVEQNVTTFDVTIEVDNSDGLLMAGMNTSVDITAGFVENALLIPRTALTDMRSIARMVGAFPGGGQRPEGRRGQREGGSNQQERSGDARPNTNPTKMVIVIKDGEQIPQRVELGISNFEQVEILSGLSEGDTVLTTMTSKALRDREAFLERMRVWSSIPGMQRNR